jgi:hypothetical protein
MTKEQLQYEIKYFTGREIPLDTLTEQNILATTKFIDYLLKSTENLDTDELLMKIRYEKHIYYNQHFNP